MKKILILINFFIFSIVNAQVVPSICNLGDTIASLYKKDADRLAIRRVYSINSTYKDSVKVNKTISENYLRALIAVYNATTLAARDTVIKLIKIHTKGDPDMNTFFISADSSLIWMQNFRNNISPVGNLILDNAVLKYGLQKTQFVRLSNVPYHQVLFKADTNINSVPLGYNIFYNVNGVVTAGPNAYPIDGNNITDSINPNYTKLIYSFGWKDCWAGCINRRYWSFKVYPDCSVEYIGSYGSAVPPNVGLVDQIRTLENVQIYPTLFKERITFEAKQANQVDVITITNILGQTIFEVQHPELKQEIDLSFSPSGIYYLKAESKRGQKVFKIIKE